MQQQRYGRIVVISSVTGPRVAIAGLSHYCASKGAVNGFIRCAALELAPHGITINGIEPGTVRTPGTQQLWKPGEEEGIAQYIPLRRLGTPEDVGHCALFLASDDSSYITGQTIILDAGQILPESPSAVL
jgi:3-oxoacyl-[acyl-carrier protein] reductase